MADVGWEAIERYLTGIMSQPVRVVNLVALGESGAEKAIKFGGYGRPIRVDYALPDQETKSLVLHTMRPGPFGHEHMADRAQILLWSNQTFRRLPRHVKSLDAGAFLPDGTLLSIGNAEEFFLLTDYADGQGYHRDLEQIANSGVLRELDLNRCDALCDYLVSIHETRGDSPDLYTRRIRELVGHGECIMGIADSYPANPVISAENLCEIEQRCVKWRWRLKKLTHRLRQVHGDFHPWNILFRTGTDFSVLDRSRGEYGDPADDVASLTMNYVFFSLQAHAHFEGPFEVLFLRFWNRYLDNTGDKEMLQVVAPFLAFRALVMASPVWYPKLADEVRLKLLAFLLGVLDSDGFNPMRVNQYCAM